VTETLPQGRERSGLATRIALLAAGIALLTGVLAGGLAASLIDHAASAGARSQLARLADAAAHVEDTPAAQQRMARTLAAIAVRYGYLERTGALVSESPLVRAALRPVQVAALRSGEPVSVSETTAGVGVYVEARPTDDGGAVVLVQRHGDADAAGALAIRRTVLAILIGVAVAVIVAVLVARRMARPLRRTAQAAREWAAGRRAVSVPADGPAEIAAVAEAFNALTAALDRSEARQREFLLSVSHDLRTPLTAIGGYAESLADGVVAPADAAAAGAVISAEADRLTRMVNDLLDLARMGADDFRIDQVEVDLTALAGQAAQVWGARCASAGVDFAVQAPDRPLAIRTDPVRLRQILDGLFDNALRVTPAGRPIVLAVRDEPGAVVVEVRDGGPGLTDADLAVAFDQAALYHRYRGVRPVGTGLGLAIAARLTARLGGTIAAGHAPEDGASFAVRLPRHR